MEETARPEYARCIDICTRVALRQMLAPSILTIIVPILVGVILSKYALATGFILAVTLNNADGAFGITLRSGLKHDISEARAQMLTGQEQ